MELYIFRKSDGDGACAWYFFLLTSNNCVRFALYKSLRDTWRKNLNEISLLERVFFRSDVFIVSFAYNLSCLDIASVRLSILGLQKYSGRKAMVRRNLKYENNHVLIK